MHSVIVHAHCYQPPREDPWLELVEAEPGAAPDHDWNTRIDRECYRRLAAAEVRARDAVAAARDPDARGGIARIVNLYAWCSFDVGPTLCEWMDSETDTLDFMRAGDAAGVARWGHGNALAAPFHHVILPLASRRDKVTEVRWGIADFKRRFNREPEGMWLPECAVDEETLEVLAQEGICFTILAPYQIRTAEPHHGLPVTWRSGSRSIAIVPYEGSLAGEVAFGGMLRDARALAQRLTAHASRTHRTCTTLATDGETFGHHHSNGDSALAEALTYVAQTPDVQITNAAALVAQHTTQIEAEVVSPSSWSCAHGVERWRSNCGCKLDTSRPSSQEWRRPLRDTLEQLGQKLDSVFEQEGRTLFGAEPWEVRDRYGDVVALSNTDLDQFARLVVRPGADETMVLRARELLEMQRAVLRTFTSCAWFFDDVARIETRQVLRYAARALELSGLAARLTQELIAGLEPALSNDVSGGTGADLFVREAMPRRDPALRAAAGLVALRWLNTMYDDPDVPLQIGAYVGTPYAHNGMRVQHARTGRDVCVVGTVQGDGPTLEVQLRVEGAAGAPVQTFTVGELPEDAARPILQRVANTDHALTAASSR